VPVHNGGGRACCKKERPDDSRRVGVYGRASGLTTAFQGHRHVILGDDAIAYGGGAPGSHSAVAALPTMVHGIPIPGAATMAHDGTTTTT